VVHASLGAGGDEDGVILGASSAEQAEENCTACGGGAGCRTRSCSGLRRCGRRSGRGGVAVSFLGVGIRSLEEKVLYVQKAGLDKFGSPVSQLQTNCTCPVSASSTLLPSWLATG
jgi:hypothetical protein